MNTIKPGTTTGTIRWATTLVAGAVIGALAVGAASCASDGTGRAQASAPTTTPDEEDDESAPTSKTITVTGQGKVTVKPDTAHVQMGVRVSGPSAADVLDQTNEKAALLIEALKALGVADDDLRTSGIAIYPQYDNNGKLVTGYEASNNLDVTIRDIARAGEIIDGGAAFAGDAITIGGIWFSVGDPEAVMADARADAIANARKRAGEYAKAAGVEVGEVLVISEVGVETPFPVAREAAANDTAGGVPIETGTSELTATVTVVFRLE